MTNQLLEQIGGQKVLTAINDELYAAMLTDELLADFFDGHDVCAIQSRQQHFLEAMLDGAHDPAVLQRAHSALVARGMTHHHYDRFLAIVADAATEVGVAPERQAILLAHLEGLRTDVLGPQPQPVHQQQEESMMKRMMGMIYAVLCYALGMASLAYAAGWLGGFLVPVPLDAPPQVPLGQALIVNLSLVLIFALQHSVMARPAFKRWWVQFVPEHLERSTYVLLSAVAMTAMMWFWEPMGMPIWHLEGAAAATLYGVYAVGWAVLVVATFWLNHFELFGLRQAWLNLRGLDYTPIQFATPGMYRWVRHPIYVGWLILIWATPTMTVSHLLFAVATTIYILVAIRFEEDDLLEAMPEYRAYRRSVAALVPKVY